MQNNNVLTAGVRAAAIEECAQLVGALAEKWNQAAQSARDGRYDFMTEAADRCADEIRALAALPGQPEPRAEVTDVMVDAAIDALGPCVGSCGEASPPERCDVRDAIEAALKARAGEAS